MSLFVFINVIITNIDHLIYIFVIYIIAINKLLFDLIGVIDSSSPVTGGNHTKDSSTPNSNDNGNATQPTQPHVKHDIMVWFEVLELGMCFKSITFIKIHFIIIIT